MSEKISGIQAASQSQRSSAFTRENRVRLYYLVTRLLPPPDPDYMGGVTAGESLFKLDELLRMHLGRLSLAHGDGIEDTIKNFILGGPEEEVLTLIEFMPLAKLAADEEESRRGRYMPFRRDTGDQVSGIVDSVNRFLEAIDSTARFSPRGTFDREGFVDQRPRSVLSLPGKDRLQGHLESLLCDEKLVGAIFIDLDNFKAVNEQFGHEAGDKCLEAVVEIIGGAIRGKGRLYRYGGDEFVILLPNFETDEVAATAERIRHTIEAGNPGGAVRVTASIGVASSEHPQLRGTEAFLRAVDEAALVSKHTTKNCVTSWPPSAAAKAAAESNRQKAGAR
ncbi:MAG: GGDEF domain-containing protein [Acidobacteriota bacterium]